MATLKDLYKRNISLPVTYRGEKFRIHYDPADLTNEWVARLDERDKEDEEVERSFVEDVVRGWDVTDDDGAPVPLDKATIDKLPLDVLTAIMDAVREDLADPNRARRSKRG